MNFDLILKKTVDENDDSHDDKYDDNALYNGGDYIV